MATMTVTGNEITDASRVLGIDGDGIVSDGSFGFWPASTNLHPNGGFETSADGWAAYGGGASINRVSTSPKFGSYRLDVVDGVEAADFCSLTELRRGAVSAWVLADESDTLTVTLSTPSGTLVTSAVVAVTTGWTRFALLWIAGDWATTTELATLRIERNGGGSFSLDGVQVQENASTEVGTNLTGGILTPYCHRDDEIVLWSGQPNLVPNGGFETDITGWTAFGTGATPTQSATWAKAGTKSLKVATDTTANIGVRAISFASLAPSTAHVLSFWLYGPATETYKIEITDGGGRAGIDFTWSPGKAVARKILAFTTTATGGNATIFISKNSANAIDFYVDQVEVKATNGTALYQPDGIRALGGATFAAASMVSPSQCWFAMRVRLGFGTSQHPGGSPRFFRYRDSDTARIECFYAISTDQWGVRRQDATTQVSANITAAEVPALRGNVYTIAGQWTPTTIAMSINGSAWNAYGDSENASTNIPTIASTTAEIAPVSGAGGFDCIWFACGRGVLSDTALTRLNALGNTAPIPANFGRSASLRMIWDGSTSRVRRQFPRVIRPSEQFREVA